MMCDLLRSGLDVATFPYRPCSAHAASWSPALQAGCSLAGDGRRHERHHDHQRPRPRHASRDTFLEAIRAGRGIPEWIYAPDAVLDATVPNWRLHRDRSGRPSRPSTAGGSPPSASPRSSTSIGSTTAVVVRYLLTWHEQSVPARRPPRPHPHPRQHWPNPQGCGLLRRPLGRCTARSDRGGQLLSAPMLIRRPVAGSVDELLDGARRLGVVPTRRRPVERRLRAGRDRRRAVRGQVRPSRPRLHDAGVGRRRMPAAAGVGVGLMDLAPAAIDHATLGAAPWGRNGWGAALLMRDVSDDLPELGDDADRSETHHLGLPRRHRRAGGTAVGLSTVSSACSPTGCVGPGSVPHHSTARRRSGGRRRCPRSLTTVGRDSRFERRPTWSPRSTSCATTPRRSRRRCRRPRRRSFTVTGRSETSGRAADGRVVLLDWAYPGEGPVCHELAWYLALNRARIPHGHTKETTIDDFRSALERHGIATAGWWDLQLSLCLLGAVVQFGWEKALGDDDELGWWTDVARQGPAAVVSDRSIADAYTRTGAAWDHGPQPHLRPARGGARRPSARRRHRPVRARRRSRHGRCRPGGDRPRGAAGRGDRRRTRHARTSTARRGAARRRRRRTPSAVPRPRASTPSSPPSR